jgi:hypothetical protein
MKTLKIATLALLMGTAGMAFAQSAPGLTVSVAAPASITTGTGRTIATIGLRAGSGDAKLESLPISLGYSNPPATPFANCALRETAGSAALNSGSNAIGAQGSGDFAVTFDTPFTVPANTSAVLYLTCDVPESVPNGAAVATSIFASSVDATSGGDSVTVEGSDPQSGATSKPVAIARIQSSTPAAPGTGDIGTPGVPNTGGSGYTGATPGIPNTGGGGSMILWTLLAFLGFAAAGAGTYAFLKRA